MSEPSYLKLYESGEIRERIEEALRLLNPCRLCPRECGVNRLEDERGFCRTGRSARVAAFNAHFGEESPLVGRNGSGTIFFSSCNLLCSFCQNEEISHGNEGEEADPAQIASMMIRLARGECHNINLVTPSHVMPQMLEALACAVPQGLDVPLVYNSSGYDKKETLQILEGIVDIYMPDFKFWQGQWSERYCGAPDYPLRAMEAIREMHRQVGDLVLDERGIAEKGLLVRHLVMPGGTGGTEEIMKFLADEISRDTYVNIMDQYRPCGGAIGDESLHRRLTAEEFRTALSFAAKAGLRRLDSRERPRFLFRL
ncbi:MAG: radical SAM protein [Desulfobacteraceae bacterium]|nr:MAG: radical SAM protein [Desulfobacteraceae bacterium]